MSSSVASPSLLAFSVFAKPKTERYYTPEWMTQDCGEDAFFSCTSNDGKYAYFGVADGVGGWASDGVDAARFSWLLMEECKKVSLSEGSLNCREIIQKAYKNILDSIANMDKKKNFEDLRGSCTCLVARIDFASQELEVANLGDSCLFVFRAGGVKNDEREGAASEEEKFDWNVAFRATEGQRGFNFPRQIGYSYQEYEQKMFQMDCESHISLETFQLAKDDLLVLASDGLTDALYEKEILTCLNKTLKDSKANDSQKVARELGTYAATRGRSRTGSTPYMDGFNQNSGHWSYRTGGKTDDVTILSTFLNFEERS